MRDPQRIPVMADALTRLWEGRPDLTLTRLLGLLETHGADWNATDEETLGVLRRLAAESPARLRDVPGALVPGSGAADAVSGRYLVTTENSRGVTDRLITLTADRVAVRTLPASRTDAVRELPQPVVWAHAGVRTCAVARPLVILDADGIPHHLGLVSSVQVLDGPGEDAPVTSLTGLRRRTLDGVYLLELGDDGSDGTDRADAARSDDRATVLLDRSLWLFTAGRRDLHRDRLHWVRLLQAEVGAPVRVALEGGEVRELPALRRITVLE